jgi:hypothetical protein
MVMRPEEVARSGNLARAKKVYRASTTARKRSQRPLLRTAHCRTVWLKVALVEIAHLGRDHIHITASNPHSASIAERRKAEALRSNGGPQTLLLALDGVIHAMALCVR